MFSAEECGACVISCEGQQYTHYQATLIAVAHWVQTSAGKVFFFSSSCYLPRVYLCGIPGLDVTWNNLSTHTESRVNDDIEDNALFVLLVCAGFTGCPFPNQVQAMSDLWPCSTVNMCFSYMFKSQFQPSVVLNFLTTSRETCNSRIGLKTAEFVLSCLWT